MNNNTDERFIFSGYEFDTQKEYDRAVQEKKEITDISKKLDLNNREMVVALYMKIVGDRMFSTAVGLDYVTKLRTLIIKRKYMLPEEIPPINVGNFRPDKADRFLLSEAERRAKKIDNARIRDREKLRNSIILNVVLAIVIAVMMYIASTSDNINIINYETKILNKYAAWASELSEKERYLNELERSLNSVK